MKRIITIVSGVILGIGLSFSAWAATVSGNLEKIDGSFYVIKDDAGKEHRIHFDNTTKKTGDLKPGSKVTVEEDNGHAKEIKVAAAGAPGGGMQGQ